MEVMPPPAACTIHSFPYTETVTAKNEDCERYGI